MSTKRLTIAVVWLQVQFVVQIILTTSSNTVGALNILPAPFRRAQPRDGSTESAR